MAATIAVAHPVPHSHPCSLLQQLSKAWCGKVARALERVEGLLFDAEVLLMPLCACADGATMLADAQVSVQDQCHAMLTSL